VRLEHLWLTDFRSYPTAELHLDEGLTAIVGDNGQGKTNLLEAIGFLATLSSFRGAPTEALVRAGTTQAIVRAEGWRDGRSLLIEAEINATGRNRVQVNKQRLQRTRDLLGALRVSVFSPDDLIMVKGGPGERRRYLDDTLVAADPHRDAMLRELDRVLKQRNALLRQSGGRLSADIETTLDVWDAKFAVVGDDLARARRELVAALAPRLTEAYQQVAQRPDPVTLHYAPTWADAGLSHALAAGRRDDLRRGVSLIGPHRDDVELRLAGLPARTHASQGEQRSLALALRLAAHALVSDAAGSAPVLLLDDVFSELDPQRSDALVACLPPGQAVLTTAAGLPAGIEPGRIIRIQGHAIT